MIKYYISSEKQIVVARMSGDIYFPELLDWHFEIYARKEYQPNFMGVTDMRTANMMISQENLQELVAINEKTGMVQGRWVCLVDTPIETALAMDYQQQKSDTHEMHYVSTEEQASNYLGIDVSDALSELDNL